MRDMFFMVTIVDHSKKDDFIAYFERMHAHFILSCNAVGTASNDVLDYLGLGETEKNILFDIIPGDKVRPIIKGLVNEMYLDTPGNGIAFTIPVSSVGSTAAMNYLTGGQDNESEVMAMSVSKYEVIIAITNRGHAGEVMDAARGAGATGGTMVHANGIGLESAEKFFGVSIAPEKDMLFIVTETINKTEIMKAIIMQAGMKTKAKTLVFSLPVNDVAGLRNISAEEA